MIARVEPRNNLVGNMIQDTGVIIARKLDHDVLSGWFSPVLLSQGRIRPLD